MSFYWNEQELQTKLYLETFLNLNQKMDFQKQVEIEFKKIWVDFVVGKELFGGQKHIFVDIVNFVFRPRFKLRSLV